VVAPDDVNALWVNQNTWFSLGNFSKGFAETTYHFHSKDNGVYAFVIEGDVIINDIELNKRDAVGIYEADTISIKANSRAEILLIEVPMTF
jgi:redox-sensitive bicupin YhaK (pirin superfamily)